jgi:hypothetical protein
VNRENPDLPILDELAAEFAAMVDADFATAPAPMPRRLRPAATRRSSHSASRIARRAAVVLVLLCLVGGVALAARFGSGGSGPPADTEPVTIGRAADGAWDLAAYRDHHRLCTAFTVGGEPAGHCSSTPAHDGVVANSLLAGGRRYVVGLAGPQVRSVTVSVGDGGASGKTHAVEDSGAAKEAGVPEGTRWFVVPVEQSGAALAAARISGHDRDGHRLGPAYLDCSLGAISPACVRQIDSRASRIAP